MLWTLPCLLTERTNVLSLFLYTDPYFMLCGRELVGSPRPFCLFILIACFCASLTPIVLGLVGFGLT
nr:hypothetical protein Q903MT_gene73 [Picea sitchensis]